MSQEVSLIEDERKLELVQQPDFNERRFPMKEFMTDLLKPNESDPKKVEILQVEAQVESRIESTNWVDNEKVKTEKEITSENTQVETKFFKEKTMYASFESAATVNLGNFNMGKVKVSLSMPVGIDITPELVAKIDKTYEFMKGYCEKRLEQEVKELVALRQ